MASSTTKQPCIKCSKGGGVATCGGCQQWFCAKHFNEHRQELATQIDDLGQEHDLIQRELIQDKATDPLILYINDWERKSIEKIQATAEKARINVQKYLDQNEQDIKSCLDQVTHEIKMTRQSEDYTETELNKWMEQIKSIRQMLEKSSNISIVDDNNNVESVIYLIEVKKNQTTINKESSEPLNQSPPHAQENIVQNVEESTQLISTVTIKEQILDQSSSSTCLCQRCDREFSIETNPGGECLHEGAWHARYQDCSYLKCGFNLGKKGSIGKNHWSCCYSLDYDSTRCIRSGPHTAMRPQTFIRHHN